MLNAKEIDSLLLKSVTLLVIADGSFADSFLKGAAIETFLFLHTKVKSLLQTLDIGPLARSLYCHHYCLY